MARQLRVEYEGAIYHVMNRGDRCEPIVKDDSDRRCFLDTLGEACLKTEWQVHACVLMLNHFHLVMETPQPNLTAGMKWFLGTYTGRFNRRHKLHGHLFAGRYKSLIVDGSGTGYLKTVCDYVHLNPARAKLLKADQPLRDYPWSSWPSYLQPPSRRPPWLRVDRLLGEHRIVKDNKAGRQRLEKNVEERRRAEEDEDYRSIRRGWFLGDETFRQELLEQMSARVGADHYGAVRAENQEAKAERIIQEEMKRWGCREEDLESMAKGDKGKVALAEKLRRETTMTVAWIAGRLHMGTRGYANFLLHRQRGKCR